jgi:predicted ABC-type ATPase
MSSPVCTIVAGPNGAGKTTFALTCLPEAADNRNFVNVDLIASGLAPLAPERELIAAGRLFLSEIRRFVEMRESFAFETTLSGKSYLKMIRELLANGWLVELIYLWLPSIEMSRDRVAERVAHGGHDIPEEAIVRRYPRSISNLLNHYAPLCSSTTCLDNSAQVPELVFRESADGRVVENENLYAALRKGASDG